ncbi:alpha/beta hydrolase [Lysobacter hankyongensis]|uniref:Alpha/beta hydrolase n=1 Tax=Lysobacter hankyongensis TaxID=1176535 RepID=A0ABP9B481_9GAMM
MREIFIDSARGRFAALRNDRTHAPKLLAMHGWLDNAASFRPMAPWLAHYDLVALDMPGHGRSFHYPDDAEYSMFSTLLDLLAAADALGWSRFAVLGHSMGGAIASMLAAAAPERIERLFLIEALGPLAAAEDTTASRLRDSVIQRRALDGKRKRVFGDPQVAVQARMQTSITALDEGSSRLLVERGIRAVEGGYEWSSDARLTLPTAVRMSETQIRDCLRAIACPTTLLVADPPPPYFTPALRDARVACVRDIRCVSMPGSHHLHMTHPAEVVAVLGL